MAHSDDFSLHAELERLGLLQFESALVEQGFDSLDLLSELESDELKDVMCEAGLKKGHQLKLTKLWQSLKTPTEAQFDSTPRGAEESLPPPTSADAEDTSGLPKVPQGTICARHQSDPQPPAIKWCNVCGWLCRECKAIHEQHAHLFTGHILMEAPPPPPFWKNLNFDRDNDRKEIFLVDFNNPRLIKRDHKNWLLRIKAATPEPVPVVSFCGPTGSGKSFLITSLMDPEQRKNGPTVSSQGQHVPESGNVFVFDSGPLLSFERSLLVDFEGEDGAVPKSLLRRIGKFARQKFSKIASNVPRSLKNALDNVLKDEIDEGSTAEQTLTTSTSNPDFGETLAFIPEEGKQGGRTASLGGVISELGDDWQYEQWAHHRRETVNQVLPTLAFLLSDVIVFVDTVEPRRLGMFFERVQEFASTAWKGCKASGWQPALILVQNKWHYSEADPKIDITKEFNENVDTDNTLSKMFASVKFLRIPHSQYEDKLIEAVELLKTEVALASQAVREQRMEQGTLYTEREWWNLAPQVAEEYSSTREPVSLPQIQLRNLEPETDDQGVDQLFDMLDRVKQKMLLTNDADLRFSEVKSLTMELFQYAVAMQLRRQHRGKSLTPSHVEVARDRYHNALKTIDNFRRCSATHEINGVLFRCTQPLKGHGSIHRNPALIEVASSSTVYQWFGWKDKVPVQWEGDFEQAQSNGNERYRRNDNESEDEWIESLKDIFKLPMDTLFWRLVSLYEADANLKGQRTWHAHTCLRCLSSTSNVARRDGSSSQMGHTDSQQLSIHMLNDCKHFMCAACVQDGRAASQSARGSTVSQGRGVVCPFCGTDNDWHTAEELLPPNAGPRVLCLDGGGIRGLVEIVILDHLVSMTGGVPVYELFDVIGGTSTGGILAIGFAAAQLSTPDAHKMYCDLTARIFKRQGISSIFPDVILYAMGHTILSNKALREDLSRIYGGSNVTFSDFPHLPKFFVTAFDSINEQTVVFGNFENCEDISFSDSPKQTPSSEGEEDPKQAPSSSRTPIHPSGHIPLATAGVATAAAPMYFPAMQIDNSVYVDGGMDANCPILESLDVAAQIFPQRPLELCLSVGAGSFSNTVKPKLNDVANRGMEWITTMVNLQMDSDRKYTETVSQLSKDIAKRVSRINIHGFGEFGPFDASKRKEIVELAELRLREPGYALLLSDLAARLRAKLYFFSAPPSAKTFELPPFEPDQEFKLFHEMSILVQAGDALLFPIHERPTERNLVPKAKVRVFKVESKFINIGFVSSTSEQPQTPWVQSPRPEDMDLKSFIHISKEAVGGCVECTISPSILERIKPPALEGVPNEVDQGTTIVVRVMINIFLVEKGVQGSSSQQPISGCPCIIGFCLNKEGALN